MWMHIHCRAHRPQNHASSPFAHPAFARTIAHGPLTRGLLRPIDQTKTRVSEQSATLQQIHSNGRFRTRLHKTTEFQHDQHTKVCPSCPGTKCDKNPVCKTAKRGDVSNFVQPFPSRPSHLTAASLLVRSSGTKSNNASHPVQIPGLAASTMISMGSPSLIRQAVR